MVDRGLESSDIGASLLRLEVPWLEEREGRVKLNSMNMLLSRVSLQTEIKALSC